MDLVQKNRIIRRLLIEKSVNPIAVNLTDNDLAIYSGLCFLLEHIERHQNGLFNFETLENDPNQWLKLHRLINYSAVFKPGSPPQLKRICLAKAEKGIRYILNAQDIVALPNEDYYARSARIISEQDPDLNDLIENCRTKLYDLIQTFANATAFDPLNSSQITQQIVQLQEEINLLDNHSEKEKIQKKLTLVQDLKKINELKQISIPQYDGSTLIFCTLAEDIGGATEKIPLVSLESVKKQLGNLYGRSGNLHIDDYYAEREQYMLCTQAIIKLPKHGSVKEVQHEAMALNISRLLGLDTTATITIAYNGHPALFIPFSDIRLLTEFTSGKTFTSWFGGKIYSHYSTIKPIGEGIEADRFINDFGNALGLLYLCSDTDAIGGNCQNKALKDGKSLFVFDQSLMDTDKFILDSRLCLIPVEFLRKYTRHGIGRNRTLIEDSSLSTKFESLMQLKNLKDKLIQYAAHVAWQHHQKVTKIQKKLTKPLSEEKYNQLLTQLSDLLTLEKDAELLKRKIKERLASLDNLLPQTSGKVGPLEVKQALIFEKLVHNPTLFSDDGRPYKNPWTYRQLNAVKNVDDLSNGCVQLSFEDRIPTAMVEFIKRRSQSDSITLTSAKTITINIEQLKALNENLLHPEHQLILEPSTNYLDILDLTLIKEAYGVGNRSKVLHAITSYRAQMDNETISADEKIDYMAQTENQLKTYIDSAYNKGFCKHMLKKFYFDVQQQLQKLMPAFKIPAQLNEAFIAALQLDKVSEFNTVVMEAVKQDKMNDSKFIRFLDERIQRIKSATNYIEAQQESSRLSKAVEKTIQKLRTPTFFNVLLSSSQIQHNEFNQVDPIIMNRTDLEKELHVVMEEPSTTVFVTDTGELKEQEQIYLTLL